MYVLDLNSQIMSILKIGGMYPVLHCLDYAEFNLKKCCIFYEEFNE